MDWEQLRERTLGEVATSLVTEGAGVAGGFVGAAFIGRQVQNMIKPDPVSGGFTNITDAAMAWGGNNLPKLAIWYLTRGYAVEPGEAVTPTKEVISDARKSLAGSVVFDTLMRLANGGANPATASIMGWQVLGSGQSPEVQKAAQADMQRLIQENSALRSELNKALQRLASQPVHQPAPVQTATPVPAPVQAAPVQMAPVQVQAAPAPVVRYTPVTQYANAPPAPVVRYTPVTPYGNVPPYGSPIPPYSMPRPVVKAEEIVTQVTPPAVQERQRRFGAMVTPPAVQERERRFGAMQSPSVAERQRRFGAMEGFMAGEEKDIATMFGML